MNHTIKIDNITYQVSAELASGMNKILQEVAEGAKGTNLRNRASEYADKAQSVDKWNAARNGYIAGYEQSQKDAGSSPL